MYQIGNCAYIKTARILVSDHLFARLLLDY